MTSVCLGPGGEHRPPDHAALIPILHHAAGEGHGGVLFQLQRMFEGAIKHVDQGF